uniref:Uncharacterized protein n=1 Tax=Syphacia muris TaxID=451379 RepID=A0A0N5AI50_9BILA
MRSLVVSIQTQIHSVHPPSKYGHHQLMYRLKLSELLSKFCNNVADADTEAKAEAKAKAETEAETETETVEAVAMPLTNILLLLLLTFVNALLMC